jgi:alpha-tubulin suppressor-like RCC1 family protein
VQVQGGLAFKQLSAAAAATCGVTTAGDVYCWGMTEYGRLGPGPMPTVTPFIAQPVKITP